MKSTILLFLFFVISTVTCASNQRCGSGYGNCPAGECCSKWGYCGTTSEYCSNSQGCQLAYGDCRCGSGFGKCVAGSCCSKWGYCGKTSAYCSHSQGCQLTYGDCKCGNGFGNCAPGNCCSQWGFCGKTADYCSGQQQQKKGQWEVIDISQFNTINNYSLAARNIDGVIMRTGYRGYGAAGTLVTDSKFTTNYNNFRGKTKIGYYFFTQAKTTAEAQAEADYVINLIKGKQNDFPIFIDTEESSDPNGNGRADHLSKQARTDVVVAFVNRIKNRGYRAGVYGADSWLQNKLDFNRIRNTGATIWVARIGGNPTVPKYDMWQYSWKGRISGISGDVDQSHVYSNVANWK